MRVGLRKQQQHDDLIRARMVLHGLSEWQLPKNDINKMMTGMNMKIRMPYASGMKTMIHDTSMPSCACLAKYRPQVDRTPRINNAQRDWLQSNEFLQHSALSSCSAAYGSGPSEV